MNATSQALVVLQESKGAIAPTLPPDVPFDRLQAVVATAVVQNPKLNEAAPQSLTKAFSACARDGLLPDGREAIITIFNGKAQYQPMIGGLRKLAYQSEQVGSMSAHVVHENDEFHFVLGDEERIEHRPKFGRKRGRPIAAYAIVRMTNGQRLHEVMDVEEIERIRGISQAAMGPAWSNHWGEMARKTVLRRLLKNAPVSRESRFGQAIERVDDDFPQFGPGPDGAKDITPEQEGPTNATIVTPDNEKLIVSRTEARAKVEELLGEIDDPEILKTFAEANVGLADWFPELVRARSAAIGEARKSRFLRLMADFANIDVTRPGDFDALEKGNADFIASVRNGHGERLRDLIEKKRAEVLAAADGEQELSEMDAA